MNDRLTMPGAVEWRAAGARNGPGTITIKALTVGERALDRPEVFDAAPTVPFNGVTLGRLHPVNYAPIMRAPVEVRNGEVVVVAELPDTEPGRQTAIEVRNGTLGAASIEFRPQRAEPRGGVRHIMESILTAVALVPAGSYRTSAEVRGRKRARRWG